MWRRLLWIAAPAVVLFSATAPAMEAPTFNDEVVRILQARCQTCHRPGEHAPFSLLSYRDAYRRRDDIRDAVQWRVMPPWKPVPGFGDFVDPRRLSDAELATLVRWIEAGAPEGDPAKRPPPLVFPEGWRLGPPDHALEMAETYTVPARASDVYRCFVIPTNFPEDRWVTQGDGHHGFRHRGVAQVVPERGGRRDHGADGSAHWRRAASGRGPGRAVTALLTAIHQET